MIDISMNLDENTLVWTADAQPKLIPICRKPNAPVNFTWLDFSAHAGTHIDAPFYMFNNKWKSDEIPLEVLNGNCQVLDMTHVNNMITAMHLKAKQIVCKRILLKTQNSFDELKVYNPNHVALATDAAQYLRDLGVTVVGYDYQSFERDGKTEIHSIFMEQNIICIDNLRLANAAEQTYTLLCLPLKVIGIDAAPARAVLLENGYEF